MFPHPLDDAPIGVALDVCIIAIAACWLLSVITREYSWVDRIWAVMPSVYGLIVAADAGFGDARMNIMCVLVVMWSIRLTFNFALKGGYRPGGEDYRWEIIQGRLTAAQYQAFNLIFTNITQMVVIWLFTTPIHQAWRHLDASLGWLDYLAIALFLAFWVIETVADAQMWRFQQHKKQLIAAGVEPSQPFMNVGLYRYSRHPNYLAEMVMWVAFYLFAISASGQIWHWTGLGCVILIALIHGSARFSEGISANKYPDYHQYQNTVARFIPNPWR